MQRGGVSAPICPDAGASGGRRRAIQHKISTNTRLPTAHATRDPPLPKMADGATLA
jgi:hypothetical protein